MQSAAGEKSKGRWFILCMVYLGMLGFAITLQSVPPLLGSIVSELKVRIAGTQLAYDFPAAQTRQSHICDYQLDRGPMLVVFPDCLLAITGGDDSVAVM